MRVAGDRIRNEGSGAGAEGYSFLELLVVLAVGLMLIGGLFTLLYGAQLAHREFSEVSAAQQASRIALTQMQHDLVRAGVGLAPMRPVFPRVVPLEDGGIRLLRNPGGAVTLLDADVRDRRRIKVESAAGFVAGRRIAIYDAFGSFQLARVDRISRGRRVLRLDRPLLRRYRRSDGAAVVPVEEVSYWVERQSGVDTLMRRVDSDPPTPIAENVAALEIEYYDGSRPPERILPSDAEAVAGIRTIHVVLVLEIPGERPGRDARSRVRVETRVTPRSLTIS